MKFKFKVQSYQTDAVNAIADVFAGQPHKAHDVGFANPPIALSGSELLVNIRGIQAASGLAQSAELSGTLGAVDLDVEMETGTGKTYVYIKSMFELNKRYGFSKFIVAVPSIAIREGVKRAFEITQEHFMDSYGKKARFFIYNSKKLDEIEQFSSSSAINAMIINIQAFNARGADARRIYEALDDFGSRRPIDVIAKNRPILILDEPQKMGGRATQEALFRFDPLFSMNFSATHKVKHNTVYVLDALEAFNKKLVKKIQVKGFTVHDLRGTNGYLYLQEILLSPTRPPRAKIELEIVGAGGRICREVRILGVGDNLYRVSGEMSQYGDGFTIGEIDPLNNKVVFLNGGELYLGSASGDVSEADIRRIQIRETIRSHFEKEEELFRRGIKVLSLFFIDEVAKYRRYDENGNEVNGPYGKIFEEEYDRIVGEYIASDTPYATFLRNTDASRAHKGYFSIDKKGRKVDPSLVRGTDISDDVSAYDLILKDKERLLSFEEPTRFIFSHSALREGWDNPNVFQICTLKHSASDIRRRQEVGRGLRLCVNSAGERMDATVPDLDVHEVNVLTVIANDSYERFVKGLQAELKEDLERPDHENLLGNYVEDGNLTKVRDNPINEENFRRFLPLWERINRRFAYTVDFDSDKLIASAIRSIDEALYVSTLNYTVSTGEQGAEESAEEADMSFRMRKTHTETLRPKSESLVKYDLVGKIASATALSRRTIATVLKGISPAKFAFYRQNPEDFMAKVSGLINARKAALIVDGIHYRETGGMPSVKLEEPRKAGDYRNAFHAQKHIREYVFVGGIDPASSVERRFAERLDVAEEVSAYAKLPRTFYIPTPVGKYSPGWAIVFCDRGGHSTYYLVDTKFGMELARLNEIENAKIACAKKLCSQMFEDDVRFECVSSYDDLLHKMAASRANAQETETG